MIGTVLANRYRLTAKLGDGGMAVVYQAEDVLLHRPVAVKILRGQYAGDQEFVERFRREAQSAASLSHPNVVNIYDVGEADDTYFIILEHVKGRNLKEMIREKGALPVHRAVYVAKAVARALDAAHRRDLVHRDVKPHNILITDEGRVKVTDFGIARAASTATLTQTGTVIGSVHYFSPEQARGDHLGVQSDLYSLGVVLYEMVTGEVPFSGESPIAVALRHLQDEPQPASKRNPNVPEPLSRLIQKAMAKDLQVRYGSAAELLADLREIVPPPVDEEESPMAEVAANTPLPREPAQQTRKSDGDAPTRIRRPKSKSASKSKSQRTSPRHDGGEGPPRKPGRGRRWGLVGVFIVLFTVALMVPVVPRVSEWIFPPDVDVPDVVGMRVEDARAVLQQSGLSLGIDRQVHHGEVAPQRIISQSPDAARPVKMGRTIQVTVSLGPQYVRVPDVLGMPLREARLTLTQEGFTLGEEMDEFDSDLPINHVVAQDPEVGEEMEMGMPVTLVVSRGAGVSPTVVLPDFRGRSLESVQDTLDVLGLGIGNTWPEADMVVDEGRVIDQNPAAGAEIDVGGLVDVVYSSGPPAGAVATGQQDTETPAQTGNARRHSAAVYVTVPNGRSQEVVILVIDDFGAREAFREIVSGGDTIRPVVQGRGENARVQVYVGGSMFQEVSLAEVGGD